jgi:hypothetical protein
MLTISAALANSMQNVTENGRPPGARQNISKKFFIIAQSNPARAF